MKDNLKNYNVEESTWQRIKRPLLVAFFVIFVIACFCLYAQSAGLFPGQYMNKPCVEKYLKENYGSGFTVKYSGYDQIRGRYTYKCSCALGEFEMSAMNYAVKDDGYSKTYLKDEELSETLSSYVEEYMADNWSYDSTELKFECNAYVTKGYEGETDIETLLRSFGVSMTFEANLYGDRVDFDTYQHIAYTVLETLRTGLKVCPDFMQVFYTRTTDGDNVVMYESHLENEEFNYSESGFTNAQSVSYYVELTAEQAKKVKIYSIAQTVVTLLIALVVVGLSVLWIVRKLRKRVKDA